jgi:class III poly(R)-hydroxyalkanoic acid synthase PhaE subunit
MRTNWTDQAEELLRSWAQARKEVCANWPEAARTWSAAAESASASSSEAAGQTRRQELPRPEEVLWWKAAGNEVPAQTARRLLEAEASFLRFLDVATAWLKSATAGVQTADLGAFLLESWKQSLGQPPPADGRPESATAAFDLVADAFPWNVSKFSDFPAIGYTREFQEKWTRALDSWSALRRAEAAFQNELFRGGIQALEDFARRTLELRKEGKAISSLRDLFDLWSQTTENAYLQLARTESFAELQANFVNEAMQYRVRERDLAEEFLRAWHLPTRRELDDAYKHLAELRREVKSLRRELGTLREQGHRAGEGQYGVSPGGVPAQPSGRNSGRRETLAEA